MTFLEKMRIPTTLSSRHINAEKVLINQALLMPNGLLPNIQPRIIIILSMPQMTSI